MKNDDFLDLKTCRNDPRTAFSSGCEPEYSLCQRSFYTIFKVEQGESIGHLIFAVGNKQWDIPALRTLLEEILPTRKRFDNYEVEHDFPTIAQNNAPECPQGLSKDVGTQMILLAIEDITSAKRLKKRLRQMKEKYRELVQNANSII